MRQEKRKSSASSGYTIIEVLIALAIFSIGFLAMGSLQTGSMMSTNQATDMTEAMTVLEDWVGTLNSIPFYDNDDSGAAVDETHPWLADTESGTDFDHNCTDLGVPLPLDGRYEVHWRVVDDEPIDEKDAIELWGVDSGTYTVSKTISVAVTRPSGTPPDDALASVEFVKVWGADEGGIP